MPLNPKQALFASEYLIDHNATQAAIRAGYSEATAYSQGQRLLKHVEIQSALAEQTRARFKRLHMDADELLARVANIARAKPPVFVTSAGDPYVDFNEITPEDMEAVAEVQVEDYLDGRGDDARDVRKVKVKMHPKMQALGLLAKHLGLVTDKIEVKLDVDFASRLEAARKRVAGRNGG